MDPVPSVYWHWSLGGLLLAAVTLGFPALNGVPLGVSGSLARLLGLAGRGSRSGGAGGNPTTSNGIGSGGEESAVTACAAIDGRTWAAVSRMGNLIFLVGIAIGGGLAGGAGGQAWGNVNGAAEFFRLFGNGLPGLLVLFGGGLLVGFGTRLSGGCTSGHGLSGCGRMQPASLVATGVFFGVAIGFTFILERIVP